MISKKQQLLDAFEAWGIVTETISHPPHQTVAMSKQMRTQDEGAHGPSGHTKNLFLKCKKGHLVLISALEDTAVDLKFIARHLKQKMPELGRFSFASEDLMLRHLGVRPGAVTPFALINDHGQNVQLVLDQNMKSFDRLNFHPLENTATTTIALKDFLLFLDHIDHPPYFEQLNEH